MPSYPEATCPLRPGDPCTLCQVDVTGPHDCGLLYLVMHDDDLVERYREQRRGHRRARPETLVPGVGSMLASAAGNR